MARDSSGSLASVDALQRIVDAISSPVFVKDIDHRWVFINNAFARLIGRSSEELLGKSDFDVFPAEQAQVFWGHRQRGVRERAGRGERGEADRRGRPVRTIITRKSVMRIGTPPGEPFIVGVISDITLIREAEARAQYLALHDVLTGLANRARLDAQLQRAVEQAGRAGERVAVICLDLDRFKSVNDLYGHAAGDDVLRVAAQRLQRTLRPCDLAARLGGDEFAVIEVGLRRPEEAESLAARIVAELSAEYVLQNGQIVTLSASVGLALFPDDGVDCDVLLSRADAALYGIKSNGRNGFAFFHAGMDSAIRVRRALEQDIRLALARDELRLVYQAQCETVSRRVVGFEALLRWRHPERGDVPPDEFIGVAESCGAIVPIGAWVLREACREAASWPVKLRVAVNVSPAQLHQGELCTTVERVLAETGLEPERLELEVTEGLVIRDRDLALRAMWRLKKMGVLLALDDFGTGYSSLTTLGAFPFDRVKVDRSFIRELCSSREAQAIVRAVMGLGRGLGVPIVAEGVETEAQLAELRLQECDEVQGFLLSRPSEIGTLRDVTHGPAAEPAQSAMEGPSRLVSAGLVGRRD